LWKKAFFSIIFGFVGVLLQDFDSVTLYGFFQGYDYVVLAVVLSQAFAGIAVSLVIKYSDNIVKCFANAFSSILSSSLAFYFLKDFEPNRQVDPCVQ
jgi:UDP-sugar transporter A1/2/3